MQRLQIRQHHCSSSSLSAAEGFSPAPINPVPSSLLGMTCVPPPCRHGWVSSRYTITRRNHNHRLLKCSRASAKMSGQVNGKRSIKGMALRSCASWQLRLMVFTESERARWRERKRKMKRQRGNERARPSGCIQLPLLSFPSPPL